MTSRDLWAANGGFSRFSPAEPRWASFTLTDLLGRISSTHSFMVDSFVHYLDDEGSCTCGPHVVVYKNSFGENVAHVVHNEWDDPQVDPPDDDELDPADFRG